MRSARRYRRFHFAGSCGRHRSASGPFDSETGPQICSVGSARAAQLGRFGCCGACCPDHDEQAIVAQADRIDGRDVVPAGC
jgi:hypothetical protein